MCLPCRFQQCLKPALDIFMGHRPQLSSSSSTPYALVLDIHPPVANWLYLGTTRNKLGNLTLKIKLIKVIGMEYFSNTRYHVFVSCFKSQSNNSKSVETCPTSLRLADSARTKAAPTSWLRKLL